MELCELNRHMDGQESKMSDFFEIEILTAAELAAKLKVRESWIIEQTKPSRASDPIPTVRLGKHNRYAWGLQSIDGVALPALRLLASSLTPIRTAAYKKRA